MVSCGVLLLGPLWMSLIQACGGQEPPRRVLLSRFRSRVLEGLGLEEPPLTVVQGPDGDAARLGPRLSHVRVPRTGRAAGVKDPASPDLEKSQMILFPSSGSSCAMTDSVTRDPSCGHFSFHFQPSINSQDTAVTSAHFWFYAGEGAAGNSSSPLFIVTSAQRPLQAAEAPSKLSSDGWATYDLDQRVLLSVAEGPFLLRVHCEACQRLQTEPDKTPFLDIHIHSRGPVRSPRHAPVSIPWSPSAICLLQRPSQERLEDSDCQRAEIDISFEELGWNSWIVEPKALTFYYCHGNCSTGDRTSTKLGISQCCAPVPGSMKSLRITTTSDGGYSFNCETLPNIMPEECTCI